MRTADRWIADRAATRHGVFDLAEAREVGFSRHDIEYRIATKQWLVVSRGVYRSAGAPVTWRSDLVAACLAGGATAVASHRSAAQLYELPGGRQDALELTCRRWRRARVPGLIVHETAVLDAYDRRVVDAIPVTSPGRTLLDLGAVYGDRTVERALQSALRRGLVDEAKLVGLLGRLGRSGRNGAGVLRRVLAVRGIGTKATDSDPETAVLQLLRQHGLPPPVTQYEIRSGPRLVARVDFAYPDLKIAIEYDSFQEHVGGLALVRDAARRNELAALGWVMLVATAPDLRSGGRVLVAQVRATRSTRASTLGTP